MRKPSTNYINIDGYALEGKIATPAFDLEVTGEATRATAHSNPDTFLLFSNTPRGVRLKVGALWKRRSLGDGIAYYLILHLGFGRWSAYLTRWHGKGDNTLWSVVPFDSVVRTQHIGSEAQWPEEC
ncbi:hypothetical protein X766_08675 [Mesorhizobium sp. LSJC255A00]|uniref:hypothetical protein n=1 Tax=unclassified Mesorhizobium TaxID=325217 RepID=UPI0003CE6A3F|nr:MULTISPECIES: hypothetical protein [unclassified Mesorhizobium]ESX20328.1 hypothetical protein X766_08675 [Mesorhizobium sp. LSJC255A00]